MKNIPIWAGSSSFFPYDTPFGYYDEDIVFQEDIEKTANWCAIRLGYPLTDIELQDVNFFAAFEEAVLEYTYQVNTYSARDNILSVMGFNTGSINMSSTYTKPTLKGIINIAKQYGSEAGVGGNLTWFTGSIAVVDGKQVYDFTDQTSVTIETGSFQSDTFTIRKIFHDTYPAINRIYDQESIQGANNLTQEFGWGNVMQTGTYISMPLYYDVLRSQAVELNEQIRRSSYSFQITNNRIRIFPIPTEDFTLWFNYTIDSEVFNNNNDLNSGAITNHGNIPYYITPYRYLNDMAKRWIRQFTLAISKEMLGLIRSKYSSIPNASDGEITLNGDTLVSSAQTEKETLITELKDILDSFSRQAQLERKQTESDALQNQLSRIPLKIYVK